MLKKIANTLQCKKQRILEQFFYIQFDWNESNRNYLNSCTVGQKKSGQTTLVMTDQQCIKPHPSVIMKLRVELFLSLVASTWHRSPCADLSMQSCYFPLIFLLDDPWKIQTFVLATREFDLITSFPSPSIAHDMLRGGNSQRVSCKLVSRRV